METIYELRSAITGELIAKGTFERVDYLLKMMVLGGDLASNYYICY